MMTFLIVVAFFLCFGPLAITIVRALLEAQSEEKRVSTKAWAGSVIFAFVGCAFLSLSLYFNNVYTDSLWFKQLGYGQVFWKMFWTRWILFCVGAGLVAFLFWLNFRIASAIYPFGTEGNTAPQKEEEPDEYWNRRTRQARNMRKQRESDWAAATDLINWIAKPLVIGIAAIIGGVAMSKQWLTVLMYLNKVGFGVSDPIFNKDVGFYIFELPFWRLVSTSMFWILFVAMIFTVLLYVFYYFRSDELGERRGIANNAIRHLCLIGVILIGIWVWSRALGVYEYMYSGGTVHGVGFVEVRKIMLNKIFMAFLSLAGLYLLIRSFRPRMTILGNGFGVAMPVVVFLVWLVCMGIVPAYTEHIEIKGSELSKQEKYLQYNIDFTRQALGIDQAEQQMIDIQPSIPAEDVLSYDRTLDNTRVWDWRPLQSVYKQLQAIRPYYTFDDIDIDRYVIDGEYREVMISARELDQSQLDPKSKTWVNTNLKYTHGYGVAGNEVNTFGSEGQPIFIVKDIPPATDSATSSLQVTRPEIYFGRLTDSRIFVNTTEEEFDYANDEGNVTCVYGGDGGIKIGGFFRKLAFAVRFRDIQILMSGSLTPDSKIMFDRQINDRLKKLAPFLHYDKDDYVVVDGQGAIQFMDDAYTISSRYPYSQSFGVTGNESDGFAHHVNYIRNSVKTVTSAYDGSVDFYVFDDADPLLQAYRKMFPGMFKQLDDMPQDLLAHVRYPEDMLMTQARAYRHYHMLNPQDFYQKEDTWRIAIEQHGTQDVEMLSYYVSIALEGQGDNPEFIQMLPFTPNNRDNMISWLAGRCDGENRGKLVLYTFSKQTMLYGPRQIESRISQNEEMSEKFTLWGQSGSEVIKGNLLVIPVNNTIIYVKPIFIKSTTAQMPELKKIVVAMGDRLEWGETFEEALGKVLGTTIVPPGCPECPVCPPSGDGLSPEMIAQLEKMYQDWLQYQAEWEKLKEFYAAS